MYVVLYSSCCTLAAERIKPAKTFTDTKGSAVRLRTQVYLIKYPS